MKYLASIVPVIILPIIIYTYGAEQYSIDPSLSLFTNGLVYVFSLLGVSLSSIAIFHYLKRNEKSNLKHSIKFGVSSFVIMYVVLFVYGILTREQYMLSHNTFNESEAIPIHMILFIMGLSVNVGFSAILGKLIHRKKSGKMD